MTKEQYTEKIRAATASLGVYRPEFRRARVRLAAIYVRIDELQRAYDEGEFSTVLVDDGKNGPVTKTDPRVMELDRLNDQALNYEKALGLTADGARKIRDDIFSGDKSESALAKALRVVGA